ncbi:MAG: IS21 family transposase [Myxococcales bacterium]|nr:IS21 family transposase [Myxococcales bacterium]
MAYREVSMWEILQVLRLLGRGETTAGVSRATGRGRRTVREYKRHAEALGWKPGEVEPDEALSLGVYRRLHPSADEPGAIEQVLLPHREQMQAWLRPEDSQRGLTLTKVSDLLQRRGVEVPYSSLHRFAVKHCGFGSRKLTVRVAECGPGEVAEVDFGRLGIVPCGQGRKVLHALVVTLVHSRHQYVHVTHSQKLPDLIEGLEDAWDFFAGVPRRVVLDNLKAAVTKADRYDPIFSRVFDEYAAHRGFVVDSTVVRHAKGKPHVERQVPYVRERFFRGEQWLDRDHVQRAAVTWCTQVAGMRIHGTTRKRPLAVFEDVEAAALQPIVGERFDTPSWKECQVHPDHHIHFDRALYSVPTRHVGKQVDVRGDKRLVRIYVKGELVKAHPRKPPGGRSTDYADYPEELAPYAMRDPDYMVSEAKARGEHVGRFMQRLLRGDYPWAHLRQAQKLLRLGNKYGYRRLDDACRRALGFDLINVRRVRLILESGLERRSPSPRPAKGQLVQLPSRFARDNASFLHTQNKRKERDHGDQTLAQDRAQETEAVGASDHAAGPRGLRPQDEDE